MKTTPGSTSATLLALMLFGSALMAQQITAPAPEPGADSVAPANNSPSASPAIAPASTASKVRIVRLSQVKGGVEFDRNAGRGFENALPNLPVTEGARLETNSGLAEVEFEDNSSVRLAPNTLVAFPQLELLPTGAKLSSVNVVKGTIYASLANTKGNDFTLTFGKEKLTLPPSSHIRLQVEPAQATLAVLEGDARVEDASGTTVVDKKKTLTFDLASQNQPVLAKNVAENQYDAWDRSQVDYQKSYMSASAYGGVPYAFGISDMNYYGSFMNAAGCGSMWRPYFASAAWDPYSNGAWAWYPSAGYSWVSPYPWGWTPYHYGSWSFCQGMGWGWMPGGYWMGLANAPNPSSINPLHGGSPRGPMGGPHPVMPPRSPISGGPGLILVNQRPLPTSDLGSHNTFVFRNDSAGLGIPRGSLGKLGDISRGAERNGFASMPVYAVPYGAAAENGRVGNARAASSLRPGIAGQTEVRRADPGANSGPRQSGSMGSGSMGPRSAGGGGQMGSGGGGGSMGGGHVGSMGSGSMGSGSAGSSAGGRK